jgi:hypothetical protein
VFSAVAQNWEKKDLVSFLIGVLVGVPKSAKWLSNSRTWTPSGLMAMKLWFGVG